MNLQTLLIVMAYYLGIYFPEQLDKSYKPRDSTFLLAKNSSIQFDFIIVGAGSAGCVVANRLTANPDWKVLLIEAGDDENYQTDTPALSDTLRNTKYDWNYTTSRQKYCCLNRGGHCYSPRGHVMGGSSTINGMMYVRGGANNYNEWEAMGNPGWNYENVLPYFLKMENMTIPSLLSNRKYHSNKGPVTIGYPRYQFPINKDYLSAGREYGLNEVDYNEGNQVGIARIQYNIRGATRCSSSKAYLDPIRYRENLFIFKNTLAIRVLFSVRLPIRAIGVRFVFNGSEYNVYASREVILSAGAINTPKLLMLSGVGPRQHLEELNIPVVKDLPVGKYLTDHPGVLMFYKMNNTLMNCCGQITNDTVLEYARDRGGGLTSLPWQIQIYKNITHHIDSHFLGIGLGVAKPINNTLENEPASILLITLLNPISVGTLKLYNADYKIAPIINPNYLAVKSDLEAIMLGMRTTINIMKTPSMQKYQPLLNISDTPKCLQYFTKHMITDEFLECYIRHQGRTSSYHFVGTARMGNNTADSVVDAKLKVHGVKNLRIIDASIMPKITTSNTNAPSMMIGEKGSAFIIDTYKNFDGIYYS